MNGYIAFYNGKSIEVYAATSHAALLEAAKIFKAKKTWKIAIKLAELNGKQYVNSTASI